MADIRSLKKHFDDLFISFVDPFFTYENSPYPPSLSKDNKLRLPGNKPQLLYRLTESNEDPPVFDVKVFDVKVFDGPVLRLCVSNKNFLNWSELQLQGKCNRIDIVWDNPWNYDLKEVKRMATRKNVESSRNVKPSWVKLINDHKYPKGKVYYTFGKDVVSNDTKQMSDCNHEEADTRMCLHVDDALRNGAKDVLVTTNDTDVVVIFVGIFYDLQKKHGEAFQLWVAFGIQSTKYYHINSICGKLGDETSRALPFFHAFTGSDTTSQFYHMTKTSCWNAWKEFPDATKAFLYPVEHPFKLMKTDSPEFCILERFVCFLYDNKTDCTSVNDLRPKHYRIKCIPPTQAALIQHTNRSIYQSSIWLKSLETVQDVPSPAGFGWIKSVPTWIPLWTHLKCCQIRQRDENAECNCKMP